MTARPAWRLAVDGTDITARLDDRLIDLSLTDNRGIEADQLDIELDDADGRLDIPPRGAELTLWLGWEPGGLIDKGRYIVDEISHTGPPDRLTLRASSADLRSGLSTRRERSWHATTLGVIVRAIAADHGLEAAIAEDLAGLAIDHIDQTSESDANLLTRLAGQHDAIATVKAGRLLFVPAGAGVSASGKPLPRITLTRSDGDQHQFGVADRDNCTAVRATYHDTHAGTKGEVIWNQDQEAKAQGEQSAAAAPPPASNTYRLKTTYSTRNKALRAAHKEWMRIKASASRRHRYTSVTAHYKDAAYGTEGDVTYGKADDAQAIRRAKRQEAADAARSSPQVAIDAGPDDIKTLPYDYASETNARRAARAEWRRRQRGLASLSLTLAAGRPDLYPEIRATLRGWKPAIDDTDWIIARMTHRLGGNGLTTDIELEVKATEI